MARVELTFDRVIKTDASDLILVEAEKMRRAGEIAKTTGLFAVPDILEIDPVQGRLVMQRMVGYTPLKSIGVKPSVRATTYARVGKALREIHNRLALPKEMTSRLPSPLEGPGPFGFLHGDMSTVNVGMSQGKLVFLDWQFTGIYGGRGTFGPLYFDCAWLINNIFSRPLHRYFWRSRPEADADAFVAGYFADEKPPVEFAQYQAMFFNLTTDRRSRDSRLKRWLFRYGQKRWNNYIREMNDEFGL